VSATSEQEEKVAVLQLRQKRVEFSGFRGEISPEPPPQPVRPSTLATIPPALPQKTSCSLVPWGPTILPASAAEEQQQKQRYLVLAREQRYLLLAREQRHLLLARFARSFYLLASLAPICSIFYLLASLARTDQRFALI
jgi:hypothetical protein